MTILLTGAAGRIGTMLSERLPGYGWELRGFDRVPVDGGVVGDIGDPADLDRAMTGVSAVVHLAGHANEGTWSVVRDANIEGLFQVFEAARRNGVSRVVFASSNHAAGFTPMADELPADTPPRPDTLYGVSKAFGEALGRYYVDRYGFQVACLRIGTCAPQPSDQRGLATWLSPDDCGRLVDAALRTSVPYSIVWGVSANTRRWWSLGAGQAIGYEPVDDAEDYADALPGGPPDPSDRLVGGGFTSSGFGIDEVAAR
jgi:uronate dehydrogenase